MGDGPTSAQRDELRRAIDRAIAEVEQRSTSLQTELTSIVESSEQANIDDEHDPEGATIAYERALVISLLGSARSALGELTGARDRLDDPDHGRCTTCGDWIGVERQLARPGTTTCVVCAAG
jgi:RNA polymerase-binding transcription factor DksA